MNGWRNSTSNTLKFRNTVFQSDTKQLVWRYSISPSIHLSVSFLIQNLTLYCEYLKLNAPELHSGTSIYSTFKSAFVFWGELLSSHNFFCTVNQVTFFSAEKQLSSVKKTTVLQVYTGQLWLPLKIAPSKTAHSFVYRYNFDWLH